MRDGVVLFYCKDDVIYPVSLSEEQDKMLQFLAMTLGELKVIKNRPQGEAINLAEGAK